MNFFPHFAVFSLGVLMTAIYISCTDVDDVESERFVLVVSDADVAENVYPRIRSKKLRMQRNSHSDIDVDVKKKICQAILASHIFNENEEENSARLPHPLKPNYPTKTIKTLVPRYDGDGDSLSEEDEEVFVCSTLDDSHYIRKLYISRQYNLNVDGDIDPSNTNKYVGGRFIFRKFSEIRLYGLAELPGKNFFSPEHDVERLYLERREETDLSWKMGYDELCKQGKSDKHRICSAVFASKYFEDKISFSGASVVDRECELEIVSFQTDYAAKTTVANKRLYREWMLPCKTDKDHANVVYLLSHAYKSNQIFVYVRDAGTRAVFPEILATDVRLLVDSHKKRNVAVPNDTVFLDDHDV